jgi:hypothetical protein
MLKGFDDSKNVDVTEADAYFCFYFSTKNKIVKKKYKV